ncbi:response regulator [Piscinibacter sakaiensis]|uniref:response regulator n=1 Tax=Piscinibacter sakaiensis TaxID=1547922 RepID=UPI003AAE3EE1
MATRQRPAGKPDDPLEQAVRRYQQAEQALDMLRRFDMLGRVYEGIAHDLNNLLGVISNAGHLLQQIVADPQARSAVAASLRSVDRASRLTSQLLTLAHAGTQAAPTAVDLPAALAAMRDLILAVAGRRIDVQMRIAADTQPVAVTSGEFELALLSLLLNAREAMPGGGQLWIDVRNAEPADLTAGAMAPDRAMVLVSVSDDGPGMPDKLARRAFEPYVTTRAARGASGLGLSRVKAFCDSVDGHVELACTAGLGTSVTMLLPTLPPAAAADPPVRCSAAPATVAAGQLAGARLLLVEDNHELADVTAALLATHGLHVSHAANAERALDLIAAQPDLDLVLSDIVMPGGIDGVELAHRIRMLRPQLPVVLITAYSTALGQAADFTVLRKPCSAEQLIDALHRQLRSRKA